MSFAPPRRMLIIGLLITLVIFLATTAHYTGATDSALVTKVGDRVQEIFHSGSSSEQSKEGEVKNPEAEKSVAGEGEKKELEKPVPAPAPSPAEGSVPPAPVAPIPPVASEYDPGTEKGNDEVGKHVRVRPSAPVDKSLAIKGCEYPIVIHVTPDAHCTGVLTLYGSIVRNVLLQPEALKGKVCVHVTYVDLALKSIEEMYKWKARSNPYKTLEDCGALDARPEFNDIVPIRFQALRSIEKPSFMEAGLPTWLVALNKVHSWGFDVYPRVLIMDADSIMTTDLHLIFNESNDFYTIAGAPDQFSNCADRRRINGGMILLKPSRYFHISALEMVYDKDASCVSGKWQMSEQELLNCLCGAQGPARGSRPEFECSVMPLYNSIWPRNYACSAANVVPIRSIHFTTVTKPWKVEDKNLGGRWDYRLWGCLRDASRKGDVEALKKCEMPSLEETRKLDTQESPPPKESS